MNNTTRAIKEKELVNKWVVIDAKGVRFGKLTVKIATLLMGKDKVEQADHLFIGDRVCVINAGKVDLNKTTESKKTYSWHSDFPGGLTTKPITELLASRPDYVIRKAVWGMLPKNSLGRQMLTKLKVYPGKEHPHQAQQPKAIEL